jgi:hypothetical protein
MRKLLSGNSDVIAVVVIVLTIAIGSRVNPESALGAHARERIIHRMQLVELDENFAEVEREVRNVEFEIKKILCRR